MMKIGICGSTDNLRLAKAIGYDYFESSAAAIAAMPQEAFDALVIENDAVKDEAFEGVKVCNGLFPGDLALVGPAADVSKVEEYLDKLLPRLERLGVETIVFGSGGARKCPEGFDEKTAWSQLIKVAGLVADRAAAHGIRVGMEHLNTAETNNLNTVAETYGFVQEAAAARAADAGYQHEAKC